jgi:aldose 1-epimerase
LGDAINSDDGPAKTVNGIDHNFILDGKGYREFARLYSDKTGIVMICFTDQPGCQIYAGN